MESTSEFGIMNTFRHGDIIVCVRVADIPGTIPVIDGFKIQYIRQHGGSSQTLDMRAYNQRQQNLIRDVNI